MRLEHAGPSSVVFAEKERQREREWPGFHVRYPVDSYPGLHYTTVIQCLPKVQYVQAHT